MILYYLIQMIKFDYLFLLQGIIVNKLVTATSSQPSKVTILPATTVKSPTKILPAPTSMMSQSKPSIVSNSQTVTFSSSGKTIQQTPQKVVIRQVRD